MYEKILNGEGEVVVIKRISDGAFIPVRDDNRDYIEFLKWEKEQKPEPKQKSK